MVSSIKRGAIISYVAIFLNIAITFFYTPWMIRQIGVSDYGLYSLIISFISYFIMDFGLHQAVQRFIAKYRAENNEDKVAKMVAITTKCYLAIDVIIFLVLLVLYFFISNIFTGLTPDEIERLKGLYVIAATFSILNFMFKPMAGAMMAFEYFVEERALEMINKVGIVLLVCLALYLGADVYALVLINGGVSLLVSVAKFIVFERKSKLHIQWGYFDKNELKNVFSFSMWTFGSGLAQRMRFSLIPTVLGILSNSNEIAIFALGSSIEGMVYTLSSGLNGLFLPMVSRLASKQKRDETIHLMTRVGRIQLYLIGLIFSGFVIMGHDFLALWVGEDFQPVYWVVIFLIMSNIVSLTQHIADNLIYVENRVRASATRIFISSLVGLCIACVLAPQYGAIGCALGTGIGLCLYLIIINIYLSSNMHLDLSYFFLNCHLKILPFLLMMSFMGYYLFSTIEVSTWFSLICSIVAYCAVYFTIGYCLCFNKEEKALFTFNFKTK